MQQTQGLEAVSKMLSESDSSRQKNSRKRRARIYQLDEQTISKITYNRRVFAQSTILKLFAAVCFMKRRLRLLRSQSSKKEEEADKGAVHSVSILRSMWKIIPTYSSSVIVMLILDIIIFGSLLVF